MNDDQTLAVGPAGAGGVWSVDADAPLQAILDGPESPLLLRQALTGVLSWQIRNQTSIGRTLTSPRLAPQWVAALLALGATVTVEGDEGLADVPVEALVERRAAGRVSALHVPLVGSEHRWGAARVARTPADEPIVAAVAVVGMDGDVVRQARVALTGVWSGPVGLARATDRLVGVPLDQPCIRAVANAVEDEVAPEGDFLGSEEYRRAMAGVLTRRALEGCVRQEVGDE